MVRLSVPSAEPAAVALAAIYPALIQWICTFSDHCAFIFIGVIIITSINWSMFRVASVRGHLLLEEIQYFCSMEQGYILCYTYQNNDLPQQRKCSYDTRGRVKEPLVALQVIIRSCAFALAHEQVVLFFLSLPSHHSSHKVSLVSGRR